MSMAEDLRREALELDYAYRQTVKGIKADTTFSDSFKEQRIAQEAAKYAQALQALQESAERMLTGRRATIEKKLAALQEAEVTRQRALLGDATLLALYRERLAVSTPEEVVRFVEESAGDWQRTLVQELAGYELARRMSANPTEETAKAQYMLRNLASQATPEAQEEEALRLELHELRDVPKFVQALDIPTERQEFAVKYGFNPANVEFAA